MVPQQSLFEVSLDGGTTWSKLTPLHPNYNPSHIYTFLLKGEGKVPLFRKKHGKCCTKDDYGILTIQIAGPVAVYSISGQVTNSEGASIAKVSIVTDGGEYGTETDTNGDYTLSGLPVGTYTLTPSKSGYTFSPPSSPPISVPSDTMEQDFIGTLCSSNQWYGEYYDNRDLQGNPVLRRCDKRIDFYWGKGSPDGVPTDNFSAKWERSVEFPTTGWYHFRAFTDDGLRLYIDGEMIIDDWTARTFMEKSAIKKLSAGTHQITMEYVEWSNDAMAHLTWYRSLVCPDDATDCQSIIVPMYQTQYLDSPMPSICTNWPNQTIAAYGCTITSIAMALRAYGGYGGIDVTPGELNDWLSQAYPDTGKAPRGYCRPTKDEYGKPICVPDPCTGFLKWNELIIFAKTKGVELKWEYFNNNGTALEDAKNILKNEHLPVLMAVNGGSHWVLATDVVEVEDTRPSFQKLLG